MAQNAYEADPRNFIEMIWPMQSFRERMSKVIIANAFGMQAHVSTGNEYRRMPPWNHGVLLPALAYRSFQIRLLLQREAKRVNDAIGRVVQRSRWGLLLLPDQISRMTADSSHGHSRRCEKEGGIAPD